MPKGPEEVTKPDEFMKIEEGNLDDVKEKKIQEEFTSSVEMLIIEEDLKQEANIEKEFQDEGITDTVE
jgi:hypothetical protein